jgi:hypothetical protein
MLRGYKGFEVDPNTGKVVEGSMYSAPTIYKNPKLMDRMTERLKGLHEDTYGEEVISSGMDSNGVWKSVSATKTSELTPDKILEVYNSVIQEPDVQMYLNQRADMMYYSAQESGNSAAYLDAKQKTNLSAIDAINNELNTKKYSAEDKKTLAGQIDSLIEENKRIDSAKADPTVAESLLKTMFQNDLLGPVKAFALSRRFEDIQTKRGYENNYHFILDAHRRRQDKIDQLSESISRQGDVTAADDISGSTTDEKKAFVADADKEIARLEAEMASPEFQTLSAALQNDKKNDLIQVKRRKEKTQAQIIEAGNKAITMADLEKEFPSFIGIFKEQMPEGSTPGEIYYQMKRTFDNPNDQDYKDFQNLYKQKTGKDFGDYYGAPAKYNSHEEYVQAKGRFSLNLSEAMHDYSTGPYIDKATIAPNLGGGSGAFTVPTPSAGMLSALDSKINAKYLEMKESRLYSERIQTGDIDLDLETSKQVKDFFVGRPITENEMVMLDGKPMSGTDLAATGMNYKVDKAFWNVETNTYELDLVGKDGAVKTVTMDGRRLQGTGLAQAMSRPAVRLGAAVMAQNSNVAGTERFLRDITINGVEAQIRIKSNGDATPYISFEKKDGTPLSVDAKGDPLERVYKLNDPEVKELLEETDVVITGI